MTAHVLYDGLAMGESPRWHDGALWVCDWLAGEVRTIDDAGRSSVVRRIEGLPFSVDWLPDGREVYTTNTGVVVGVVAGVDLAPYGGSGRPWNEIVVDPAGRVYVNMPGSMPGEEPRPGIAAVITPDGVTRDVAEDLWFPNGMAVTPDGLTLIVAESHAQRLTAFTITDDGSLTDRRVWAELGPGAAPDGICLDANGAVWYADVPNRHCRRVAEGGQVLDTVEVDRGCFACMLGGPDGRTLFIVATDWERLDWQRGGGDRTGQVLTFRASSPRAGRP
ncbi:SMP-30/gluconolactonase/LRE family protein [Nocardioides caricicola]|uniref:SMP-30/gluconolactonase/LRE family protein n=1 Tax=Nocardioides caricicola TaxID=634770 RepID=A0ABW0N007_9ACTN